MKGEDMKVIGTDKNGDEIAEVSVTELDVMFKEVRKNTIDEFVNTLIPRLTDAIYQKDVESMTNLINDVTRELKEGVENE